MPVIHANMSEATVGKGKKARRFRPDGRLYYVSAEGKACRASERAALPNPVQDWTSKNYAARLLVGLNVGDKEAFSVEDVIGFVVELRKKAGRNPDASIVGQYGVFTGRSGDTVIEKSVQIIILDFEGLERKPFTEEMQALAETLCKRMDQELVVLEIQRKGVVVATYGVTQ